MICCRNLGRMHMALSDDMATLSLAEKPNKSMIFLVETQHKNKTNFVMSCRISLDPHVSG